jgi:PleD family two-component response regulator
VTVSAGVADLETAGGPERLFRLADQSLYRAKQGGRDRVVVAGTRPAG